MRDFGTTKRSILQLTQRDNSPALFSKYPKFNLKIEKRAKEDIHRSLLRDEITIQQENKKKSYIASWVKPLASTINARSASVAPKLSTNINMGRRSSTNFSHAAESEEIADVENTVKTPIINRNSDFSINAQLRKASLKME